VRKRELESSQARLIAPEEAWKGVGHRNPSFAEIIKGLAEGAAVVLHPGDRGSLMVRRWPAPRFLAQGKDLGCKTWVRRTADTPTSRSRRGDAKGEVTRPRRH